MRVAGSRLQGPVGQVSRGLGARAPRAWAPPPRGLGPFPHKNHQTSRITIFRKPPGGILAKAWVSAETAASEVGTPLPPPPTHFGAVREKGRGFSPSPPSATIQHAPQGRRIPLITHHQTLNSPNPNPFFLRPLNSTPNP